MKVRVEDIKVGSGRFRKTFDEEKLQELANSMREFGLIEPVVIGADKTLIAGERRLKAAKMLGWKEIDAVVADATDEWQRKVLELEENLKRSDLSWQEEVMAKKALHELYQKKFGLAKKGVAGGWRILDTSEVLGESEGSTTMDLQIADMLEKEPGFGEGLTKTAAYRKMRALAEREKAKAKALALSKTLGATPTDERWKLLHGDAREILKSFDSESIDFCVTDPPFAVGLDETVARWWSSEKWVERTYTDPAGDFSVHEAVFKEVYRVLKPGSHCYVFFATATYTEVKSLLENCGFQVSPIPLVWVKGPKGVGTTPNPYYAYGRGYATIFFARKGSARPFNIPGICDVFEFDIPTGKIHPTENPTGLLEKLIENCSNEWETGLDPFAGSGSFLMACKNKNRLGVGIEIDDIYYTSAFERLFGGKKASEGS